ncbi:hypothetical protein I4U23_003781 [Adineta vaga]|nr:hypothetical protein I4U23_003781 [Adineta vaga]
MIYNIKYLQMMKYKSVDFIIFLCIVARNVIFSRSDIGAKPFEAFTVLDDFEMVNDRAILGSHIKFSNLRVPVENILYKPGTGAQAVMEFDLNRLSFIFNLINADEKLGNEDIITSIENSIKQLFSLWILPCSEWLNVFTTDAVWYHPKFPDGLQYNQLQKFCELNQATKPALFRQDGEIRLTISGNSSTSSLYHVMVPYVYGQIEQGNNDSLFINSGYEYVQLVTDQNNVIRINMVVEFFNRASLPFVWPDNN